MLLSGTTFSPSTSELSIEGGACHECVVDDSLARACPVLFAPMTTFVTDPAPIFIAAGDLNGDNRTDLIAARRTNNSIVLFRGYGNESFERQLPVLFLLNPSSITLGDLNGDHLSGLVVVCQIIHTLYTFVSLLNGSFVSHTIVTASIGPRSVALADFNKENQTDMAVTNEWSAYITIFLGFGDGNFVLGTSAMETATSSSPQIHVRWRVCLRS